MDDVFWIYGRYNPPCASCSEAKEILKEKKLNFQFVDINDEDVKPWFISQGYKTVPQVFYGLRHIGGVEKLKEFLNG